MIHLKEEKLNALLDHLHNLTDDEILERIEIEKGFGDIYIDKEHTMHVGNFHSYSREDIIKNAREAFEDVQELDLEQHYVKEVYLKGDLVMQII